MSKQRPDIEGFRKKALASAEVRNAYDELSSIYEIKRQMIAMRKKAGKSQEEMAELLGTKKSNISRLESINSSNSPRLATVEDYARALGYTLKVEFQPESASQ